MTEPLSSIELLTSAHEVESFDCGKPALTQWLRRYALDNQRNHSARVWVLCRSRRVIAYYALATSSVAHENAPARVGSGLADHEIPVILLARLAVEEAEQGHGFGSALLKDALMRTARGAEDFGIRALLVHAQDEEAAAFYSHYDFEPSPTDDLHLFLLMKDLYRQIA